MRKFGLFIFGFVFTLLFACQNGAKIQDILLLHTNDNHGSVLAADSVGGLAERATYIREMREKNRNVLLVDAGDINAGQPVSNLADAEPDILAYNAMEYDAVTFGNHEFDKPLEVLLRQMQWATFPFVVSNVEKDGKLLGKEYLIKEYDGVKVGIFGITTKDTKAISVNVGDLNFSDEIETARKMVKKLKAEGADLIIALSHLGFTESHPDFITSQKLAEQVDGIDIIVDGHSHSYIEKPMRINHTFIVTANQSGRYVGTGKMTVKNKQLIGFDWKPVAIKGFPADTVVLEIVQPFVEKARQDLETVIGQAKSAFVLFKNGANRARYEENALGNLIADALKWKADELNMKADFALINSGGIREGLEQGSVSKKDILTTLPFSNVLEVVELKGADVKKLFGFLATLPGGNGAFPQLSAEVEVVFDREGKKVQSLKIQGKPVADTVVYTLATCDYVAAGKDGYDAGLQNAIRRENTSLLLSDVVSEYIRKQKELIPQTGNRIRFTN